MFWIWQIVVVVELPVELELVVAQTGILFTCLAVPVGAAGGVGNSTLTFFPVELLASSVVSEFRFATMYFGLS